MKTKLEFPLMDAAGGEGSTGGASLVGGAIAPPAAAAPPSSTTTPPAGAQDAPWFAGIQDPSIRTWAEAKGFKDPLAATESAYNLEKLVGFDKAGRTLVIPKDDAPLEEVKAFRTKLGVPETADAYKLPLPAGADQTFSKAAAGKFHELGLTAKQAEGLGAWWNETATSAQGGQTEKITKQADAAMAAVKTEWGQEAAARADFAGRAFDTYVPAEIAKDDGSKITNLQMVDLLKGAGLRGFAMKMFSEIGKGQGEHGGLKGGGGGPVNPNDAAAAKQRIAALSRDREWTAKYTAGDADKAKEMNDLHYTAFGGGEA